MKVYLAGYITGYTAEDAQEWRTEAKRKLAFNTVYDMGYGGCHLDNDGDGDCPNCAHGQSNPFCRARVVETGIVGYSPMRAKEYLTSAGVLLDRPEAYDQYVLSTAAGITARDSWDVATSDLILINLLGTTEVSIGTVLEVGMGYAQRKPMVCAMESDNVHVHAMFNTMIPWIVDDLDYAIDIAKAILLPDGVKVPA